MSDFGGTEAPLFPPFSKCSFRLHPCGSCGWLDDPSGLCSTTSTKLGTCWAGLHPGTGDGQLTGGAAAVG